MPRVFLLDPAYPESVTPGFLRHAAERAGWDIVRPQFFLPGMDGTRWFADFERGLAEAQILVGLGDFMGLMQWGARLDEAFALLRQKIDAGAPLLLSGTSSLTPMFPSAGSRMTDDVGRIRDFLGLYGIHITGIKVASRIQEVQNNTSQLCCVFHSEDDDLIDPQLFDGVDKIVAYGNRLISYDPGVFPIVEACRAMHFFADEGDSRHRGNLGQRNAVAVRQSRSARCLMIVMTGKVLNDCERVMAGALPGWVDNQRFADNLIDLVTAHIRDQTQYSAIKVYELFSDLETSLGQLIQSVLVSYSQDSDFSALIPESVRKKLHSESRFDYARAYYLDLVLILKDQFPKFEYLFHEEGRNTLKLLFEINSGPRVHLAHPHKAAQLGVTFGADDADVLTRALELVRRASARLSDTL